jgi:hypothetical protein
VEGAVEGIGATAAQLRQASQRSLVPGALVEPLRTLLLGPQEAAVPARRGAVRERGTQAGNSFPALSQVPSDVPILSTSVPPRARSPFGLMHQRS